MPPTPEHDALAAANEPERPTETLSRFYDWLGEQGYTLAQYGAPRQRHVQCPTCRGRRFDPTGLTAREQQLLSRGLLRDDDRAPCPECDGSGARWVDVIDEDSLAAAPVGPSRLIAEFMGVDEDKLNDEKRAILDALQERTP